MSIEKEYECETKNSPFLIRLTKNKKIKSINYTEEFKLWREKRTNKVDADRCSCCSNPASLVFQNVKLCSECAAKP